MLTPNARANSGLRKYESTENTVMKAATEIPWLLQYRPLTSRDQPQFNE